MSAATDPRGARRPSLDDVAARAGVSRSTASLVIRNAPGPGAASRDAVHRAATELGYRPDRSARALAEGRSRLLGVMFTTRDPFHADLIDALYPAADARGYELVLSAVGPGHDERRAAEALLDSRCEGLIVLGSPRATTAHLPAGRPLVAVGWQAEGDVDSVRTADATGVGMAVDHLVGLGHHAIVHVDGGRGAGAADRRKGYRTAMRRHGLAAEIRVIPGDYSESSGVRAAEQLLGGARPVTAVIASNDRAAVGVLDTVRRLGVSVPGELSIVGYDDSQLARLAHIDLTSIRQDGTRLAELAVEAAVGRLDDHRTERLDVELEPQLVVRGTTAGPGIV